MLIIKVRGASPFKLMRVLCSKFGWTTDGEVCAFHPRQLAVSLFGNTQVGKMRNTYEHQRVSDGKIQITILILRRGPYSIHKINFC